MAAEVPVSDVLCEAMEYLSKLGSNLRARSENLKEKRVRKEKLKNSHAVQKAASKVLLICELSKKSLDNVEAGVRRVLSMLEASQAPIGGKNSKYHYFEYKSRKLRIEKKIPLKHFMSVKVLAKEMSTSMQDKYPVYYNCKLKRQRKRVAAKLLSIEKTNNHSDDNHHSEKSVGSDTKELNDAEDSHAEAAEDTHTELLEDSCIEKAEDTPIKNAEHSHSEDAEDSHVDNPKDKQIDNDEDINTKSAGDKHIEDVDDNHNEDAADKLDVEISESIEEQTQKTVSNHEQTSPKLVDQEQDCRHDDESGNPLGKDDSANQSEDNASNENKKESDSRESRGQHESNRKSIDMLNSDSDKELPFKSQHKKKKKHSKHDKESKKSKRIKYAIYSSDSNEESKQPTPKKEDSPDINNKEECGSDSSNPEPKAKKLKSTSKDKSTSLLDSDDDAIDSQSNQKTSGKDSTSKDLGRQSERCDDNQSESSGESKPLIRCVNLSKLLKPSVLDNNKQLNNTSDEKSKNDRNLLKQEKKIKKKALKVKEGECEFRAQKRKEVNEFKPKMFSINIVRLPELSSNFLLAYKLKKITELGNVICEIKNESDTPNSKRIKAVKSALLNDSESDDCGEIPEAIQVKKSLLKDSDSDHNTSDKNQGKKVNQNGKKNVQEVTKETESNGVSDNPDRTQEEPNNKNISNNESTDINSTHSEVIVSTSSEDKSNELLSTDVSKDKQDVGEGNSGNEKSNVQSNENETETPTKMNLAVKSSLLHDSSDEDLGATLSTNDNSGLPTPKETADKKEEEQNNSGNEQTNVQSNESTPTKTTEIDEAAKDALLKILSDDPCSSPSKQDSETPTKTNENIKSSLLNDSSDENKVKTEEESATKDNEKVKSSLLNDSSDVKTDETDQRERKKTPRSKRKFARKCREAKQKLRYGSSSDSEQEKPKRKLGRKKSQVSSSSSSEDIKTKGKKKPKNNSESNDTDNNKSISQVDGAVDERSNSSVDKMVRSKAKPSGSSSQNSDNQDASDKDIDGLTNLNNLNKTRRRDISTRSREEKRASSLPKAAPIISEDMLKAESSSEVSDVEENDMVQDLPAMTLSGLNGDHMAKDDLLGETDSSLSHNEKEQSENPDNSDEDTNVKSKRRKAHAISSDSESGTTRRKLKLEKISDFEDSEDESSEAGKKSKRKKKPVDSDASVDSKEENQKKRRRIKVVHDSEGSGSDTENEGRNKHGRKNIRKVMGKNQLEEATKKAAREEKERIARITERQKLYNNLDFDESGKPDEVVLEKVVLDFDPETKEPLIQVDRGLVKKLKPHQANGIKFMWDACFESVKRIKKDKGSGCILAHCMGLGKTLQVISLTHTLLVHGKLTGVNRVLVVCPLSTVLNWVNEFRMWLKHAETEFEVDVYELSRYKQNSERAFQLQQWFEGGGVCVLGYEMFRNLSADNNKKFKKKMLKSFQESLVEPGPDLVVCDEGHLLKNEKTSLSQSMNKVKTLRRIVLTGTPLQNNLKEYYCMVQFVKPNLLGKYNEYLNRFVNPITNGQYTDSTEHDIRVMKRRSHVLHKMLDGAVQRRDYGVLAPFLPPKHEYVLFITLTDVQVKLYQFYLDNYSRRPLPGKSSGFLFPDFQSLQRIWTHPLVLKYNSERYEIMQQKKREREEEDSEGSLVDFIDDDSTPDESSTEESSDDLSDLSDDSRKKSKKKKSSKKSKGKDSKASTRRGTRANPLEVDDEDNNADEVTEVKNENPTEWWIKLVEEEELEDMRNSHKLILLFDILRQCETIGDKLLVFSQSLYSLDLIEHFLGKVDEATQDGRIDEKLGGHVGSWSPGVDYFRLDGSTSCENRSIWCKNFNREDNPRARLFLISTRAGGLGINLVAANRVVIFDVSWNPSHDVQSIFRVYRFGQKKPCYVYRFLAMGTMEEKIYERQVTKQAISKRVIDEQQIDRHYAENDLAELYKFEARPAEARPLPSLPKDRLFAEMLREHEAQIYKYHEHDSLLENKEEETLSEEERKAAWEDFENEKNKPPPAPFPSAWPMHNGMVPGLLAQQQQQLAYAALAAMLRKDMPNINDNQIRDMLPLIFNSNPAMFGGYDYGLMPKMGEIYKYAQPGMMNPAMMNPVMNAGGGGAGGASGLQYEPPWQRQHQQQQQLRLQQLMQQQQNQMGAKFYAGGLGSRDPIAMALQQQRAREMLMGGGGGGGSAAMGGGGSAGGGRPRGRPPLQPRHPTTTSQDVVNLDSD